jgi:hypothetical protein
MMNQRQAYDLCCRYKGKVVSIRDNRGCNHIGTITKVDRDMVWIMPSRNRRGYGLGYWGYPYSGFGVGIALGTILGIALVAAF